jgi:hypothetical protein
MQGKIRNVCGFVVLMVATFVSTSANAQVAISPFVVGGNGYYGGGTAEGNYLAGEAQVIRAEGDYNLSSAQAASYFEDARAKYIDNTNKWTQAYFEMREANQAFKAQYFARNKHSPKTLASAAASGLPRSLSLDEFNPSTGRIEWPKALRGSDYGALRTELARLFESRARDGQMQSSDTQIHEDARKMARLLRGHVKNLPANDYIAARKFVDSLEYSITRSESPTPRPGSNLGRGKDSRSGTIRTARVAPQPGSNLGGG